MPHSERPKVPPHKGDYCSWCSRPIPDKEVKVKVEQMYFHRPCYKDFHDSERDRAA